VVVVICTPGDGNHIALDPDLDYAIGNAAAAADGYAHDAPDFTNARGSIVITHDAHSLDPSISRSTGATNPLGSARGWFGAPTDGAPLPWFGGKFAGLDDVVTVSPAVSDGGARS
jgi:hypothetical protein